METLYERYKHDTLTNNTQLNPCKQCKDCKFWYDNDIWSNSYTKANCEKYPYGKGVTKPLEVINNTEKCEFYEKE